MRRIVLIGAGGLAAEMVEAIKKINRASGDVVYEIVGLVVEERYYREGMTTNGYPVIGTIDWLIDNKENVCVACAVGTPKERARIQRELTAKGIEFVNIVEPDVFIADTAVMGKGIYIAGGSSVSTYCNIGDGVILNGGVLIGHDTSIGAYTCMMTRADAGGRCKIGEEILVGAHAYIVPDRKIGNGATIAAGSVVFTNVKPNTTVLGNPARRMKELEN